jgi:hypothetical protein
MGDELSQVAGRQVLAGKHIVAGSARMHDLVLQPENIET